MPRLAAVIVHVVHSDASMRRTARRFGSCRPWLRCQTRSAQVAWWAALGASPASGPRNFSTGSHMLAHPSKRKHGLPGEDAYFVHDGGGVVVIGVADGTSVAGVYFLSCMQFVCARRHTDVCVD